MRYKTTYQKKFFLTNALLIILKNKFYFLLIIHKLKNNTFEKFKSLIIDFNTN